MTVILSAAKNLYLRDFYILRTRKILRSAQNDSWDKMVFEVTRFRKRVSENKNALRLFGETRQLN